MCLSDVSALSVHTRTQLMTGQSTSAHLGRSTTTTVELRSPSGRSPKTCWRGKHISMSKRDFRPRLITAGLAQDQRAPAHSMLSSLVSDESASGNKDRKIQLRWQETVFPGTWTTDKRPCRTKPHQVNIVRFSKRRPLKRC